MRGRRTFSRGRRFFSCALSRSRIASFRESDSTIAARDFYRFYDAFRLAAIPLSYRLVRLKAPPNGGRKILPFEDRLLCLKKKLNFYKIYKKYFYLMKTNIVWIKNELNLWYFLKQLVTQKLISHSYLDFWYPDFFLLFSH